MQVNEIFRSLDGEINGFHGVGQPSMFVRLQGCNLDCPWCDTARALDPKGGSKMDVREVFDKVRPHRKVTITGGEPLLQMTEVVTLVELLAEEGIQVTIETNGTIPLAREFDAAGELLRFVVDYKPQSRDAHAQMKCDYMNLRPCDVVKFLVRDMQDVRYAKEVGKNFKARKVLSPVLRTPVTGVKWSKFLAKEMARDPELYDWQLNFQLHKVLGIR